MTRTARAPRLSRHLAEPFLEIHPADAERVGLAPADLARVTSPTGEALLRVLVSSDAAIGAPFAPIHWTGETAPAARIGPVVAAATDPVSGQPETKAAVVAIERFPAACFGFAVSARPFTPDCRYWARMRTDTGWRAELASETVPEDWQSFAGALFGHDHPPECLTDLRRGFTRLAYHEAGRVVAALFVSREPVAVARDFVAARIGESTASLLAARPGSDLPDPGPTVCACVGVGRNTLVAAIEAGADLEAVCSLTGAGTNCGSCRPEIAALVQRWAHREAAE